MGSLTAIRVLALLLLLESGSTQLSDGKFALQIPAVACCCCGNQYCTVQTTAWMDVDEQTRVGNSSQQTGSEAETRVCPTVCIWFNTRVNDVGTVPMVC